MYADTHVDSFGNEYLDAPTRCAYRDPIESMGLDSILYLNPKT